jgi:hypothetical protein
MPSEVATVSEALETEDAPPLNNTAPLEAVLPDPLRAVISPPEAAAPAEIDTCLPGSEMELPLVADTSPAEFRLRRSDESTITESPLA